MYDEEGRNDRRNEMKHILITGERGTGKSSLISRLAALSDRPLTGFRTRRMPEDADGLYPVNIYPAAGGAGVCVGRCRQKMIETFPEVFDTAGCEYLKCVPGGLVLMDELGLLESGALRFQRAVFDALDGELPVLAAVKARRSPFLDAVRAHPGAIVFELTVDTREALFEELRPIVESWNLKGGVR